MRTYHPRFEPTISQKLSIIATDDELATLRQIIADAQTGRRTMCRWYVPFVAAIIAGVKNKLQVESK